jgi:hypothetical protein
VTKLQKDEEAEIDAEIEIKSATIEINLSDLKINPGE